MQWTKPIRSLKKRLSSVVLDTITTRFFMLFLFLLTIPVFSVVLFTISLIEPHFSDALRDRFYAGIYSITVASIIFSVILAMIAARPITQPLLKLVRQVNQLSHTTILEPATRLAIQEKSVYEINALSKAFNLMLERLKEEHSLREEFVATLTHDLKVPLLAEKQTLNYLSDETYGPLSDTQREILQTLQGSNNSCLKLVQGLLEVYRYNSGNVRLNPAPVSLQQLLNEACQELLPLAQEKSIKLIQEYPPLSANPGWIITADGFELKRTLQNLLSNALTNTPKHGKVTCKLSHQSIIGKETINHLTEFLDSSLSAPLTLNNQVIVSIKDSGIGFSGDDLDHLFEQFSARRGRNPMSIGLGLYNANQVVQAHQGKLWVETTEGEGSAVNFMLPPHTPVLPNPEDDRRRGAERRKH
ncbi:MAG: ATP-binding protein [Candidatus Melainabacteria bacterium]